MNKVTVDIWQGEPVVNIKIFFFCSNKYIKSSILTLNLGA